MPLEPFHPAVKAWFTSSFSAPTPAQHAAWPAIKSGKHTLIAAPTGSGKTLAAFLAVIDDLVWEGLRQDMFGCLEHRTHIVYVSPLKALSSDIQQNLKAPLAGIRDKLRVLGLADFPIHTMVRTGDTPQSERERMRRQPPHILVTTPESLYILLTSDSGRRVLSTTRTLIVDEIHALAGNKRGSHLALSIERLQDLCTQPLTRIGLSATQKPIEEIAHFLTGAGKHECTLVDCGHVRDRELMIEVIGSPLEALMSSEAWGEVYDRLAQLAEIHNTTLIFVNTRRLAERVAKALAERLGEDSVTAHHGSLAREHRQLAEQRLRSGSLRALVTTSSLELGIDIGDVDLVCQLGSPRAIGIFLQRVGRSGHALDAIPKGCLFPTSRDELGECVALLDAVNRGELDRLVTPEQPLDVLAQQIVAEVSCEERDEEALYKQIRRAWPYHKLERNEFEAVITMLANGFATRRGRRGAWLHRDSVNKRLRPRRGAKLFAILNGGAIPDQFDYDVILQPESTFIGTLNEDFAIESLPGDIFQLGNTAYRLLKTERGRVHVEDAQGQPPNIPFWFGEAPGRSDELSEAVSRQRLELNARFQANDLEQVRAWLEHEVSLPYPVTSQLIHYLGAAHAALGVLPTQQTIVFERFFDEAGDQHLVIHAPYGSRLNRAWGLALRKRFCRKFNFELQSAATEDAIVLSLGSTHSFPLEEVAGYLKPATVREVLIQALLDAPMFTTRWRWNVSIALAIRRNRNGKRVPPQLQRMDAEDLLAVIFPDQLACLENVVGQREIPDHPLVQQTIDDCLHEMMDIDGLEELLGRVESGEVRIVARDLTGPSPLAQEILVARPYAFLDDAPAEERRTQMVQTRRFVNPQDAAALRGLSPDAIARVKSEAWPEITNAEELHDALMLLGYLTRTELEQAQTDHWMAYLQRLVSERRATQLELLDGEAKAFAADSGAADYSCKQATPIRFWVCAERLAMIQAIFPDSRLDPEINPVGVEQLETREQALIELVRGRLECMGPVTAESLAATLGLGLSDISGALLALESEGFVIRGLFTPGVRVAEWCERGLLARIHRYTLKHLRAQVQPVSRAAFMRFLFKWQGVDSEGDAQKALSSEVEGPAALARVIEQLEGFEIPAGAWEREILHLRLKAYQQEWLDRLCLSGRVMWLRVSPPATLKEATARHAGRNSDVPFDVSQYAKKTRARGPLRTTPLVLISRLSLLHWDRQVEETAIELSENAHLTLDCLTTSGASFFTEIISDTGLSPSTCEEALGELVSLGLVSSDSFMGLRGLLLPASLRKHNARRQRGGFCTSIEEGGRWFKLPRRRHSGQTAIPDTGAETVEHIARVLLRRYGIVFRALLVRESGIPSWRELLYIYRRLEARGELRGGRFIEGFAGEQFALPDAVGLLRKVSRQGSSARFVVLSAADPLNLVGIVLPGDRVPAIRGNRVLYRDGVAVATLVGGVFLPMIKMDSQMEESARTLLTKQNISNFLGSLSSQEKGYQYKG